MSNEIVFQESFSDNRHQWTLGHFGNYQLSMQSGNYFIEGFNNGWRNSLMWVEFDQNRNFSIQSTMGWLSGVNDYGFGLTFGVDGPSYFLFLVAATGHFMIEHLINGQPMYNIGWEQSRAVSQNTMPNHLMVRKNGFQMEYLVNNHLVKGLPFEELHGFNHGFHTENQQNIRVDNFMISYH